MMRFTAIALALAAVLSSARGGAGSLDPTFGVRGKVTTAIGSSNHGFAVAIDRDGKIVVAGNAVIGSGDRFAIVRYTRNGSRDRSFRTRGVVTTRFCLGSTARDAAVQKDGRIVVVGNTWD